MCQSAVFKSDQCEKRNLVQQQFDVRNRDGAVDTSQIKSYWYYRQLLKAVEKTIKKIMHLQKPNQNFSNKKFEKLTSTTLTQ